MAFMAVLLPIAGLSNLRLHILAIADGSFEDILYQFECFPFKKGN